MSTKKLQIIGNLAGQASNADTVDGKHASDFAASTDFEQLKSLVGDTAVSEQITQAVDGSVADWSQADETASDYIKNKPQLATDDEIVALLSSQDFVTPVVDTANYIYLDSDDNILIM